MAQTLDIQQRVEDRERLLAIVGARNVPLKHVRRAKMSFITPSVCPYSKSGGGPVRIPI